MVSTYSYRLLKSGWGIAIDLTAESVFVDNPKDAIAISHHIWLKVQDESLTAEEIGFLSLGLRLVADRIHVSTSRYPSLLINVLHTWTNYVDYQPQGYACAIIGWASKEFDFELPAIDIEFIPSENRYRFSFASSL